MRLSYRSPVVRPVLYFFVLLVVTGIILLLNRPTPPAIPTSQVVEPGVFNTERHLLWIRQDSLERLLNQVATNQTWLFSREGDRWQVRATDPVHKRQFEALLLNGGTLARFTTVKGSPVIPSSQGYGLSLPIKEKQGTAYVHIPVECLSSLLAN